jgi:hypothetical protein
MQCGNLGLRDLALRLRRATSAWSRTGSRSGPARTRSGVADATGLGCKPPFARGVEIVEVVPGECHSVQQRLDLGVGLGADRLHLALVAVAAGLCFEERSERRNAALPQHITQPIDVCAVVGAHRRGSGGPGQAPGGPGWGQTVDEATG